MAFVCVRPPSEACREETTTARTGEGFLGEEGGEEGDGDLVVENVWWPEVWHTAWTGGEALPDGEGAGECDGGSVGPDRESCREETNTARTGVERYTARPLFALPGEEGAGEGGIDGSVMGHGCDEGMAWL